MPNPIIGISTPPGNELAGTATASVMRLSVPCGGGGHTIAVPVRAARSANSSISRARHRPGLAVADGAAVDRGDRRQAAHRAGDEHLVGVVEVGQAEVADVAGQAGLRGEFEHRRAGDPLRAGERRRRAQPPAGDQEKVGGVGLGDESAMVEHHRVVGARGVRLDLGQDRRQQVVVVDLRIQAVRRWPPHAGGDQGDPGQVVDGRLVFGEHDQSRPGPVQPRIHPAGDLLAPGEREPDVHVVGHPVGAQGPPHLLGDLLVGGHGVERERLRRAPQPGQVLGQPEDAPLVQAQALPDRVAALYGGVERADRRLDCGG